VIPEDNCRVIIESVWIDKFVDLSHSLIINEIDDIPSDILDDLDENNGNDKNNDKGSGGPTRIGEGVFDYNITDLIDIDNRDDDDDDTEEV